MKVSLNIIPVFFSRLKFKYKLTIYFTLFGILVGYLSFIFYTSIAANNLKHIVTVIVGDWIENNGLPDDAIESYIGKPYDSKMNEILPFMSVFSNGITRDKQKNRFDIYYYSAGEKKWYRLFKNTFGIINKSSINISEESEISEFLEKGTLSSFYTPIHGETDNLYFWINLTRAKDKNIYITRIIADRKGVFTFIGGREVIIIYTLSLFVLSLLLSKAIALHISKPISKLSSQTAGIASGDLEIRTEILSKDEIGGLSSSINVMADRIKENLESVNKRMEAISVMNKIDKAVLSSISRYDLIDRVTFIVSDLFNDCLVGLAMADIDKESYVILSHYIKGIKGASAEGLTLPFSKLGTDNFEKNKTFYIVNKKNDPDYLHFLDSIIGESFLHLMNIPIYLDEGYIGSLIVGKDLDNPFTEFETATLKALADQTGVAMKSVKFFEEKENLFLGILIALSKTIDAKSRWTSGHSERVASYSEKLAVMIGMGEDFISSLRISANLHDIGKIGVPEAILDKPARLTSDEFDVIKNHPGDGAGIVENIPGHEKFINGILFHHESWNGEGYPFRLKGREIPLMGRIIAVADVYDSLISDRPYRDGMGLDQAITILISEKGEKLDPGIVDMMIEIIENERNLNFKQNK